MTEVWACEYRTGPMPADERWALRLGSRAAVERARRTGAVRFLGAKCLQLVKWGRPTVALHNEIRRLLAEKRRWAAVNRVSHINL
jgi:hypothetical protein